MSRYSSMFDRLGQAGEGAFGAFVMLGDPAAGPVDALIDAIVEGGADMLELGIPFSDPVADGPVIQASAKRALEAGVRTGDCFAMIARMRARHPEVPIGILTYANIVMARGIERFAGELADAGADSLLIADVPALEAEPFAEAARVAGIAPVLIAAINTPDETLKRIADLSKGYVYCVARAGVTGSNQAPAIGHSALFEGLARHGAALPVLGFGISTPRHVAAAIKAGAAGVISGSAIVERAVASDDVAEVSEFVRTLKAATKG